MKPVAVNAATRRFGEFVAVDSVDLDVAAGEVVGLLGANGAGKTTLIRMILGLLQPSAGEIRLFGGPQTREMRGRVGYVPQNLGLYRDLTTEENLEFRAQTFGIEAAATVPFDAARLVGELPLGLQRRAAFVAATQHNPELLVLDEPTSGVSPLSRTVLWSLIRERAEAGVAVLVSTHYMDEAEQADRLVLMSQGRVAATGSLDGIIGGQQVVEVRSASWNRAFGALDQGRRLVTLAGTTVRIIAEPMETIERDLEAAGVEADLRLAPATLDEAMVVLAS